MEGLAELTVRNVANHGSFLCANIYSPVSQQLNTVVWLTSLYGFEASFSGGRFQNYGYSPQEHSFAITRAYSELAAPVVPNKPSWFGLCLNWIGEEIKDPWHITAGATFESEESSPDVHFHFSFANVDEAIIFKLKFA